MAESLCLDAVHSFVCRINSPRTIHASVETSETTSSTSLRASQQQCGLCSAISTTPFRAFGWGMTPSSAWNLTALRSGWQSGRHRRTAGTPSVRGSLRTQLPDQDGDREHQGALHAEGASHTTCHAPERFCGTGECRRSRSSGANRGGTADASDRGLDVDGCPVSPRRSSEIARITP